MRAVVRLGVVVAISAASLSTAPATAAPPTSSSPDQGRTTPDLIDAAERRGEIDAETADLYRAYALSDRWREVPPEYRSVTPWDGTLVLRDLHRQLPRMQRGSERRTIRELIAADPGSRDSCGGNSASGTSSVESAHFYVEYQAIQGGLNIAHYTASLETTWATEVDSYGWAAPPVSTTNPAPNDKYPVIVDSLGAGLYGFVSPSGTHTGAVGNNPNTTWNDVDARASCMVLNVDYGPFPGTPQQALDATTAHEFTHSLQFGYGALHGTNVPDDAFVEGIATWMEDEVFDSSNDNYNYLWPDFTRPLGDYSSSPYPTWVIFRGLTERFGTGSAGGGEQVMEDFWELISQNDPSFGTQLPALNKALVNKGSNLPDAYHAMAVATWFLVPCGGGFVYPHCLQEASGYSTADPRDPPHETVTAIGETENGSIRTNYALNWADLPDSLGPYDVSVQNTASAGQFRVTVGCRNASSLDLVTSDVLGPGETFVRGGFSPTTTPGTCSDPVAVVTNQTQSTSNPPSRSYQVKTAAVGTFGPTLTVTRNGAGTGTVTSDPPGISCGSDCSELYDLDEPVTLTAAPGSNSTIQDWTGCDSETGNDCEVTMNAARNVTATFGLVQRQLTVSKVGPGAGKITGPGVDCGDGSTNDCLQSYDHGTDVTLTAVPGANGALDQWTGCDSVNGAGQCLVDMLAAKSVTATFEIAQRHLTVSVQGSGTGSVTGSGIDCGDGTTNDCANDYDHGTDVTLTPLTGANSQLTGWTGCDSVNGSNQCLIDMTAARSVTATFGLVQRSLMVAKDGPGLGRVTGTGINCGDGSTNDCSQSYDHGTDVTLTAVPGSNGLLDTWTGCDSVNASDQCLVDMTSARSVTATFAIDPNPPPPDPQPSAPTAKQVDLSANKRRVEARRRVRLTVEVEPCAGHQGESVLLQRRNRAFTGTLDASCVEIFRVRIRRSTTFTATSPQQDTDHLTGTSNPVRVRVRRR